MSVGVARVVADAALDAVGRAALDVLHQLAERLGASLAARRVRRDLGVRRQVEHVRKPTCTHVGRLIALSVTLSDAGTAWLLCLPP